MKPISVFGIYYIGASTTYDTVYTNDMFYFLSHYKYIHVGSPILLSPDPFGLGYLQHVVLASGELWKRHTSGSAGVGSLLYRKRYFELSNIALTYFPTEKKTGV